MTEQRVNDSEMVMERRIIRGRLPRSVAKSLTREVLGMTFPLPTSLNTQPWYFCVASGVPFECSGALGLRRVMHARN